MKFLRASVITGFLIFQLAPALAWIRGVVPPGVAITTMGINGATYLFLNVAQSTAGGGSSQAGWPGALNSNGLPTSSVTSSISSNDMKFFPGYFGHYKVWFTGTSGALSLSSPMIAYSGGGALAGAGGASGSVASNPAIGFNGASQPSVGTPLEFAWGALVNAVTDAGTGACATAGGTSGLVCLTASLSGPFGNVSTGSTIKVNNVTNLASGPWTLTKLDSNHIQLQGSTYSAGMAINSGAPGVQSEVILQVGSQTWSFPAQGSFSTNYSNFTGIFICRSQNVGIGGLSDCANIGSHYANPDYATMLATANPRWVRFMDQVAVQYSFATSFAGRPITSQFSFGGNTFVPGYWAGLLTNTADAFVTASNPTLSPATGGPVDGETVIGYIGSANTTTIPTLAVNRTGFGSGKPILGIAVAGLSLTMSGAVPTTGAVISFVFTGGGLASPFTYNYGVNANSTNSFTGGTGGVSSSTLTISAVGSGAVTLGQFETGSGISGNVQIIGNSTINSGACSPACTGNGSTGTYALSANVTVANGTTITGKAPNLVSANNATPDTSFTNITNNIRADITNVTGIGANANSAALRTAHIVSENPEVSGTFNMTFGYNPNINSAGVAALGTGLTITGSDSTASATYNFGYVPVGALSTNSNRTFVYSATAGGWINQTSLNGSTGLPGPQMGPPLEFFEDLVKQASVGMWLNMPVLYSDSAISSTAQHVCQAGVKELVMEISNETWNSSGGGQWHPFNSLGQYIGLSSAANGGPAVDAYTGLRFSQMMNAARNGWSTGGCSQSKLFGALAGQFVGISGEKGQRLDGGALTPGTNVTLAAYGGSPSNGTTTPTAWATDASVFPNRPVDWADGIAIAPYWNGSQFNSTGGGISPSIATTVPLSSYNCSLVASYNYVNGNASEQTAALNFMFLPTASGGPSGDFYTTTPLVNGSAFSLGSWPVGSGTSGAGYFGIGSIVAGYDAARTGTNPHTSLSWNLLGVLGYEGDNQSGPITSSDVTTITGNLTTLGDTAGYTSGLGASCGMTPHAGGPSSTVAGDASNMQVLFAGFKNSDNFKQLYLQYFNDFTTAAQTGGVRLTAPGTYGLESTAPGGAWSKYPGTIYNTPAFQSLNAIGTFN